MKNEAYITNILTLTAAGLLILITGLSIYYFRDIFSRYVRFFLPIPPLAVAAYIYVYNMFEHYNGELPADNLSAAREIVISIVFASTFFSTFVIFLVIVIQLIKKFLT